jgi:signal transduction histidine kinase
MWETISAGREWSRELQNKRKNGELYWERATISGIRDEKGEITHYIAVKEDITERKQAEVQTREAEAQSQLSQKLQSVGMLAAGVAHEINTPTQYITDNVRFLTESFTQIFKVIAGYKSLASSASAHPECAQNLKVVEAVEKENELEYLLGEIPRTLEQSLEGLGRIGRIVSSLKEFSHPNQAERSGANLNKAIETVVAVSRHEWKYVADVVTEFDPKLPQVECILDEINQAVLNLVINATHAIADAIKQRGLKRGTITIRTRQEPGWVVVEVEDTGTGILPEVQGRIFDPFFTTKGIGKGTGQGLAIVQAVVVKGHGGRIDFLTEVGKGTTFRLFLPLSASHPSRAGFLTPAMP